ncbi:MAG: response regulator [Pirellulales bacterium]|nr:response regulator [Pirellulales bacterium]
MVETSNAQILLIDRNQDTLEAVRAVLGGLACAPILSLDETTGSDAGNPDAETTAEPVRVDWVPEVFQAIETARGTTGRSEPYALVMIRHSEAVSSTEVSDTISQLLELDPQLEVLMLADGGDSETISEIPATPWPVGRIHWLVWPLEVISTRELVVLLVYRYRVKSQLAEIVNELKTTRRALDRAREEAIDAARVKNEFVANVSHEIRTPMNAILGFSNLLMNEPLTAGQREKLDYVRQAGISLLKVITHVLDFSKLATGEVKLQPSVFNVDELIHQTLEEILPTAYQKGLTIRCHIEESVPIWLQGDRIRLRQILSNLVENAVKYTQEGSIHVRVTLDDETTSTVMLRMVVTDTGVGIPLNRHEAIFEGFSQADGSSTRCFEGVGVGLAICKELASLMGGQIGVRSEPDKGSTFWFTALFRRPAVQTSNSGAVSTSRQTKLTPVVAMQHEDVPDPSKPHRPQILVAEDDPLSRALLEVLLSRAGCVVDLVGNGREALDAIQQQEYDLVFMDIDMPELNGLEAIRLLRQQETERHMPVIALTAKALPGDRETCLAAGADHYLAKPFNAEELLSLMQVWVPGLAEATEKEETDTSDNVDLPPDWEKRLERLIRAMDEGDYASLESEAQAMKNLARQSGKTTVADQAMRIQLAARRGDLARAASAVSHIRNALANQAAATSHTSD